MANTREPMLQPIPVLSLRPTQMTVGMREVKEKRKRWRERKMKKKQAELLGRHMIPVVLGPDQHYYVVDHHHLALSLHDEGVKDILVTVIGDLTMVERDAFWNVMDNKRWAIPTMPRASAAISGSFRRSVTELKDDPSAASPVNCAAPAASPRTPRRSANSCGLISCAGRCRARAWKTDFAKAMEKALTLAKSEDAIYLPGWCGPASDD